LPIASNTTIQDLILPDLFSVECSADFGVVFVATGILEGDEFFPNPRRLVGAAEKSSQYFSSQVVP